MAENLTLEEAQILEKFKNAEILSGHTVVNCAPRKKAIQAKKENHPSIYWTIWVVSPTDETLLAAMRVEGGRIRLFGQGDLRENYKVCNFKEPRQ